MDETSRAHSAPVSILVLTKDEEVNIAACLQTLTFSDDIVVLDSFSTDRTVEIAQTFPNVRVIQRAFDTWSNHSNWALTNIDFKYPWVYYSDADELVTPELRDEIAREVSDPHQPHAAFRLRYQNMFRNRWIRRGGMYPVWILRLYRPDKVRYEDREVNAHPVVDGSTGQLREHFIHQSFNKGLVPWFTKHNAYSKMEAREAIRVKQLSVGVLVSDLITGDGATRRRAVKNLSFRLPCRAAIRFFYMFLWKRGILDGFAGFHYAAMISMYEDWIALKIREHNSDWRNATNRVAQRLLGQTVAAPDSDLKIDVVIPTFNEADHIADTVANARQLGNVFVLDSCSSDGTQQLARGAGASVVEHPFEGYAAQKNWGLDNLPLTGNWVFILDADERLTPDLRAEIVRVAKSSDAADGYFVNRLMIIMGRAVRHGGLYPSWNLRFFRRGRARYEHRSVHEHMVCDGATQYLRNPMLHIRRESVTQYIAKHVRYADLESDEWVKRKLGRSEGAQPHRLFRSMLAHRQWLRRHIWPRLPWRPLWRFLYMYVVRLGVLDGRAGLSLAFLMASYEYMISLLYHDKLDKAR